MICDQDSAPMINVGRMIQPGRRDIWADGYVCQTRRCPGYAIQFHDGAISRWPACTLDSGVSVHAKIKGAISFRDAQ